MPPISLFQAWAFSNPFFPSWSEVRKHQREKSTHLAGVLTVQQGLLDLLLGGHDEGTVLDDSLLQGLAGTLYMHNEEEA